MKSEKDAMLETDRLDELLEEPARAQPVVVVQYRNRGVPSWIFFPLLLLVPLGVIVVYHRTVVEHYRVQAAQADSLLEREISNERASRPLVRNDPPPTTVLPGSRPGAIVSTDAADAAVSPQDPGAATTTDGPEKAKPSGPMTAGPAPATSAAGAAGDPVHSREPTVAGTVPPAVTPAGPPPAGPQPAAEKPAKITMRSVLRNPFADDADAPRPPAPGVDPGSPRVADQSEKSPAVRSADPPAGSAPIGPGGQGQPVTAEQPAARPVAPPGAAPVAVAMVKPLPTKEEAERQIQEEAARREAEIRIQLDAKSAEVRAQRLTEQQKFRDELAALIRSQGNRAGPDIEALSKRYGYEFDPDKMRRANRIWRLTKSQQAEKVRALRQLELPESVLLGFLYDDIYRTAMGRNGPRSESEVRVRAARLLLSHYPLVAPAAARPAAAGAAAARAPAARTPAPAPGTVVSTPR